MKPTPEPSPSLAARLAEQTRVIEGLQEENDQLRRRVRELERLLEQKGIAVPPEMAGPIVRTGKFPLQPGDGEPAERPTPGEGQPRRAASDGRSRRPLERRPTLQGLAPGRSYPPSSGSEPPEAPSRDEASRPADAARQAAEPALPDGGQWGVLALDNRGRVVALNKLAVEMLTLPPGTTGRRLFEEVRPDLAGSPLHLAFLDVVRTMALGSTSPLRVKLAASAGKPALTAVLAQRAGAAEQITLVVQKDER